MDTVALHVSRRPMPPRVAYRDLLGARLPRLPHMDGVFSLGNPVPSIAQTARLVRGLVR